MYTYIHNMLHSVLFWNVCLQITTFLQPSLWSQYTYLSKNLPECEVTDMHAYIICMLCKWDFLFHGISKSGMACLCLNLHYCVKSSKNHALDDIGDRKGTSCINYLDLKY